MSAEAEEHSIEVVRGRLADETAEAIIGFWSDLGALDPEAGRRRLPEVVCVLRDGEGNVAGVNSVYPQTVEPIGGRLFWIYRSRLADEASDAWQAMLKAAFEALEAEFDPERKGPIGLCVPVPDRTLMKRYPEAEWTDPRILYAGYFEDGSQIRIGYFAGAKIL